MNTSSKVWITILALAVACLGIWAVTSTYKGGHDNEQLTRQLNTITEEKAELEKNLSKAEGKLETAEADLAAAKTRVEELTTELAGVEGLSAELEAAKTELTTAKTQVETLTEKAAELETVKAELTAAKTQVEELTKADYTLVLTKEGSEEAMAFVKALFPKANLKIMPVTLAEGLTQAGAQAMRDLLAKAGVTVNVETAK